MSILSDVVADLSALIFPPQCEVCGRKLSEGVNSFCMRCRMEAPLTGFAQMPDNPLYRDFWGQLPVVHASALLYYSPDSKWREVIHGFKYRGRWRRAVELGEWYGEELRRSGWYNDVDVVIPIPLHPIKRILRGYNQSEYIAEGICRSLGVKLDRGSVIRHSYNRSQTQKSHQERWEGVEGIFSVRDVEPLRGKHILLVDDVITTGATVISCAEAILKAVPDARLSIGALAVTQHHRKPH